MQLVKTNIKQTIFLLMKNPIKYLIFQKGISIYSVYTQALWEEQKSHLK